MSSLHPKCPKCGYKTRLGSDYLQSQLKLCGMASQLRCNHCHEASFISQWLDLKEEIVSQDTTPKETRKVSDTQLIAHEFKVIMSQLGLDTSSDGLKETPDRVARFLLEFNQDCDLVALLKSFEHDKTTHGDPMVVMSDIPLAALCEHHFCPFLGTVDIGYLPNGRVVGLSKLARLVRAAGHRRPTVQERLTDEIADALQTALEPKGVIVVARAQHTCMSVRGIQVPGVTTTTSSIRGVFVHNPTARSEFLSLVQK